MSQFAICCKCGRLVIYEQHSGRHTPPEHQVKSVERTNLPLGVCTDPECELVRSLEEIYDGPGATRVNLCACGAPVAYNSTQCDKCRSEKLHRLIDEFRKRNCPVKPYQPGTPRTEREKAIPND